jgi:hypothetical protein
VVDLRLVVPGDDDAIDVVSEGATASDVVVDTPAADLPADADDDTVPELTLPGRQMTVTERATSALRHWWTLAVASCRATFTKPGTVYTDQPPSIAHHVAYYRAAPWVPEGHRDRSLLVVQGRAYGFSLGLLLVALGYSIAWIGARQLRLYIACLLVGVVVLTAALQ